MNNTTKTTTRLAAIAGLALTTSSGHAAAVFAPAENASELFFAGDVSDADLLDGLTGTVGGSGLNTIATTDVANFNDGFGRTVVATAPGALGEVAWLANTGTTLEFILGAGDGAGYDISGVTSFADWNGGGFPNQKYDIFLRTLGGAYVQYTTVDYQPFTATEGGSTKVIVTDDGVGGLLGSGIDAIRFDFLETVSTTNGGTVFSEIDVFGTATVPEPSTSALLGGLLALGAVMTRRRSA